MTAESGVEAAGGPSRRAVLAGAAALSAISTAALAAPARPRFAYVGCFTGDHGATGKGIVVCRIDPVSGDWTEVQALSDLADPYAVTVNPAHGVLYSGHSKGDQVSVFTIDRDSGRLTPKSRHLGMGVSSTNLTVDPSGRFLLTANYESGSASVFPILADGDLGPIADQALFKGPLGPGRVEQATSHPHKIVFDPAGRFFCVPDKGLDRIVTLRLDPATGKLTQVSVVKTRSGAGPRHMSFHPRLPLAYAVGELNSTLMTFAYDPATGALTPVDVLPTIPRDFTGDNAPSTLDLHPSARVLYTVNRGQGSVAGFRVDANGRLTPAGWTIPEEKKAGTAAMTPDGGLLCVNTRTSVRRFKVDTESGKLTPLPQAAPVADGVGIAFL